MRLTKEVTEDLVKEVAGEDTIKLVGLLKEKDNISEFKLAEKLRLTVNTVRNMLYRLQAHNLVTSTRKKDKKKGWYIYYWTFNTPQARSLVRIVKQKKLEQLKERLKIETQETFYVCPENCVRFKMENAMDYDFKCPECGTVLHEENNIEFINKLKEDITQLKEELAKPVIEVRTRKVRRARKGKSKLVRRSKPAKRVKSRLAKRGRPKLAKTKKLKLLRKPKKTRSRSKLDKKGRLQTVKARRPKLKRMAKKTKKARTKSKSKPTKRKPVKKTIKRKVTKPKIKAKARPKKKSVLKRVKKFLKRK